VALLLGTDIANVTLNGRKMSRDELIYRMFKLTYKEKCEQKADEYADTVASSGSPVSYDEAFQYYMDTYLPQFKKAEEIDNAKTH
tara:strand:- start:616 stop:870 length:255 start_codon:yes stop_codon:yes gene_type:complete